MISIYILSGPVHSGKTTKLSKWLTNKNAAGILAPVINSKRYLLNIVTNEKKFLDSDKTLNSAGVTSIGGYVFENSVFDWGCEVIKDSLSKNYEWLIIDEFGPLELCGKGLAPSIDKIFSDNFVLHNTKILFVIRANLVQDFLNYYKLTEADLNEFNFPD